MGWPAADDHHHTAAPFDLGQAVVNPTTAIVLLATVDAAVKVQRPLSEGPAEYKTSTKTALDSTRILRLKAQEMAAQPHPGFSHRT
jgi:hypothetical protein